MRGMRKMGLLAVAAMAITAFVGTTAASAETPGAFTTNPAGNPLQISTLTDSTFLVTGSTVTCKKGSSTGTAPPPTSSKLTTTTVWEECTAFGFAGATVNTAGCSITLTATTTKDKEDVVTPQTSETHAPMHLENCTAGGMTITVNVPFVAKCKVLIPNQEIPDAAHYENNLPAGDIIVKTTPTEVDAIVQESTGACPLTVGTHTNAAAINSTHTTKVQDGTISYDKDHGTP